MKYLKYILGIIAILAIGFFLLGVIKSEVSYDCQVIVDKPLAESWAVSQDESKMADWLEGFQKIEHISGTPDSVGAVSDVHFITEGQEMVIRETITEIVPNESVAMTFTSDFMDMDYKLSMNAVDGKTKISSSTNAKGNGMFSKSLMALMSSSIKEQEETNLANLKKVIEENESTTPTLISETLELTHCESAVYDAQNNRIYASLIGNREDGDGSVATIGLDGKILNKTFVAGLNDPKGIAITKDKLYVSDVTELVEADLKTGKILNKYTSESIAFLNDVAIDNSGNVYVSDTRTSEIYQLGTNGNFSLWLADAALDNPNGLLVQGNTMYVASWGSAPEGGRVSKIDMNTKSVDSISTIIGNLDGIRPYDANRMIISDWRSGNIHLIDAEGNTENILTVGQSVGDIAYVKEKQLLLLPMNKQSRLLFYKLK
ncbi:SRPBCC family protein [Winogradskyella jejuensis]|uniref:Polyketide cyclase / dehydrase and lipid transport n=1 Tax=Winogradskyella jejuensis TaxID=1089305 RepID=A0A1M5UPA5_9FLAO|nr:SRPBCC family protein [Winogradskyella jejuensis]SHH64770.1 Polyketide cyclase / dehydrase and lipid transport [Winogradskyella jejuensis]